MPRERVLRFFRLSPNRTIVVAGSTVRGEESAVLGAFADKNVDTGKVVSVSGVSLAGTDASNRAAIEGLIGELLP